MKTVTKLVFLALGLMVAASSGTVSAQFAQIDGVWAGTWFVEQKFDSNGNQVGSPPYPSEGIYLYLLSYDPASTNRFGYITYVSGGVPAGDIIALSFDGWNVSMTNDYSPHSSIPPDPKYYEPLIGVVDGSVMTGRIDDPLPPPGWIGWKGPFRLELTNGGFNLLQVTDRAGGGPCSGCCGIDHRQPILSQDGRLMVLSSTWNVDDFVGNLNPERNRELFVFDTVSNKFTEVTLTTNGFSVPYSFYGTNIAFISTSSSLGTNVDANADVFLSGVTTQSVRQCVSTIGPVPIENGTNCPYAWFTATNWLTLANLHVDLSAEGRRIVWASNRNIPSADWPAGDNADGNYEIYCQDIASGEVRQITHTAGGDNLSAAGGANLWPRTSADGSRIVFVSNRSFGGPTISSNRYGIFLADTNGSVQRVTNVEVVVDREFPAFGMDSAGARAVFVSDADLTGENTDHNAELFAINLNNASVTQITRTVSPVVNRRPILSGDGLKVAFVSNGNFANKNSDGSEELWIYNFDADTVYRKPFVQVTSQSTTPSTSDGRISWADWYSLSRDGRKLVFTSNADLVGKNSSHAYEVFMATFAWNQFKCAIASVSTNKVRINWPSLGGLYTVESCTSLVTHAWAPVLPTNQWPIATTLWTNTVNPSDPEGFYRVRATTTN